MADPVITPFASRPFVIGADLGFPTGLGGRASYSPIPQLGIEAHVGSILLFQTYGVDLTYRPLAGAFSVSPMVRVGVSAMQSNLAGVLGGPAWQPLGDAQVGVEWRTAGGFSLSAGVGGVLASPGGKTSVIPAGNLTLGYAF